MPLQPPPDPLDAFPERPPGDQPHTLYRIFWHRNPATGDLNSPWRFSSVPPGWNRFDLPDPEGTCYWSDRRYGAFLEVFRGATLIADTDVRARRIWTGTAPHLRLADLLAEAAYALGVTAAISTQPDYALPQAWAAILRHLGFDGLVGTCSHDPTSDALNIAVFGDAGTPNAVDGWTVDSAIIEDDTELIHEIAAFGARIVPVPFDVAVSPPPA
jgi:hypothetical protein